MRVLGVSFSVRRPLALGAAVVILGAAAGAAVAGVVGLPNLSAPAPSGQATAVPQALSSTYSIFRRAKGASDALPAAAAAGMQTQIGASAHYGLNGSLARFAGSADGTGVWLVPGSAGSCIVLANGGGSCGPNSLVTRQGVVVGLVPTSGAATSVVGVVPDGARVIATDAAGAGRSVALSGNAFSVTSAANTVSFTIDASNGGEHTETLPPPAPPGLTP